MSNWFTRLFSPPPQPTQPASAVSPPDAAAEDCKNRGNAHLAKGELDLALACYRKAIDIDPGYADAHNNVGLVYSQQGMLDQALTCFQKAISIKPTLAKAHVNCGNAFRSKGLFEEASAAFHTALALDPELHEVHNNLGVLLQEQGKLDEAIATIRKAISLKPESAGDYVNLGLVLQEQGKLDEAEASYRKALSLDSDNQTVVFNMALLSLLQGRLAAGWAYYESRFFRVGGSYKRNFPQSEWSGEALDGKSLLIWGEQGVGDEIMFAGMFAEAIARTDRCVIECTPKLVPLFARSFPRARIVPRSDPPHAATRQPFDCQCAAGGLAKWLRPALGSFPRHEGYLTPSPERVAWWKERLAELGPGLKVGICWRSGLSGGARHLHYTKLDQWGPIFAVPGVQFVNLQYDECSAELATARQRFGVSLHAFAEVDLFDDLDEAAALTQALDRVISAPTAAGCLAAALNVPTWTMCYGANWTAHGAAYHPWFPAVSLFPRRWDQDWEEIIGAIAQRLQRESQEAGGISGHRQAPGVASDSAARHKRLGDALQAQGRLDEAIPCYQKALALDPRFIEAHNNLATAFLKLGRVDEAVACFNEILTFKPDFFEAHYNLGVILQDQHRFGEAVTCFRNALSLRPDYAAAHGNMGVVCLQMDRLHDAQDSFQKAIALNPACDIFHNGLGLVLRKQGRLDEALASIRKALALTPAFAEAYKNQGLVLHDQGELDEAEASYRKALALDPAGNKSALFNLAVLFLSRGDLSRGWEYYVHRFSPKVGILKRDFPPPEWLGDALAGKAMLVWGEQGIGDEIMFASMFAETIAGARHCVIECAPKLVPLFSRSFPAAEVVPRSDPPHPATSQQFDYQTPAGGLAKWLRPTVASFPRHDGYLAPDPARVAYWKARLAEVGPGLKVGICWRSSLISGARHLHYTTLDQWGPIFTVPDVHFVNLQYDDCTAEMADARGRFGMSLHAFPEVDLFDDLDEAAALTKALDLVISAPTAAGVLAASLGVPTWEMAYGGATWVGLGTDVVPWLPALQIHQRRWNQPWEEVIADIAQKLGDRTRARLLICTTTHMETAADV